MAMDYAQTAELMNDAGFQGRTKSACLKFAMYIFGEPSDTPAFNTRQKWARNTLAAPDQSVSEIMPALVWDPNVQEAGTEITDPDLQSAVETSVNKFI